MGWNRVSWALTLAMPLGVHCLWPWMTRQCAERVLYDPAWSWAPPRPLQWTVWFIGVFMIAAFGVPRAMAACWHERAPRPKHVVDPSRGVGYRSPPPRCWDEASVERAVRWACRVYSIQLAWTLAVLNALAAFAWYSFIDWRCGGHWGCAVPPPSDYVPLLVAELVLVLACLPRRGRILRLLPAWSARPARAG